jgi:hypothetical protein
MPSHQSLAANDLGYGLLELNSSTVDPIPRIVLKTYFSRVRASGVGRPPWAGSPVTAVVDADPTGRWPHIRGRQARQPARRSGKRGKSSSRLC